MLNRSFLVGCGISGGAAHRYWRVRNTQQSALGAGGGAGNYNFAVTEIEMRAIAGSSASDLCSAGTAIASSSSGSYPASNAFNNIIGPNNDGPRPDADWIAATTGIGEWIGYDFGVPVSPVEVWISPFNLLGAVEWVPALAIDYSDDGSSWTQHLEYTGLTWVLDTAQTFQI